MTAFRLPTPSLEPIEIAERKAMTAGRELEVLRLWVRCAECGKPCRGRSTYQIDHLICLEIGGKDDASNMRPLCIDCHKLKTALDQKLIAKAKRLAGETCTGPSANPLPFSKRDHRKRKLNGTVVDRKTGTPLRSDR